MRYVALWYVCTVKLGVQCVAMCSLVYSTVLCSLVCSLKHGVHNIHKVARGTICSLEHKAETTLHWSPQFLHGELHFRYIKWALWGKNAGKNLQRVSSLFWKLHRIWRLGAIECSQQSQCRKQCITLKGQHKDNYKG